MPPFRTNIANLVFEFCSPNQEIESLPALTKKDWDNIFQFAARNGVAPWLFYKIKNNRKTDGLCPDEIKQKLRMQYLQTLVMNQQKWKVYNEIRALAEKNGIKIIPLKGTALAFTLYPEEALRPMGDIDILIPEIQIDTFRKLMLKNGATRIHIPISQLHEHFHAHISALSWQNIMIEPHQRLFSKGNSLNLDKTNLFEYTIQAKSHPETMIFNDIMQAYHLSTHAFKGYKMGGMRLGWLLDLALLILKNQDDHAFIQKVIRLNPKAKKQINAPFQWASLLLKKENNKSFDIPFPEEITFHSEQKTRQRHKFIVLNEIAGLPGISNKFLLLFRAFFPEKPYMDHRYGKHRGFNLFILYLKRIIGISRPRN
jgi:hypothetical protein